MKNGLVVQTKMAEALNAALHECIHDGRKTGRVGHRILTNNAKKGVCGKPAVRPKENHKVVSADSAVIMQ